MDIDDMKVIWDSQNNEPLYAVNQDGLRNMIEKKSQEFRRLFFWQEVQSYFSSFLVVGVIAAFFFGLNKAKGIGLTNVDAAALIVGLLCWIIFSARVFWGRMKQRQREKKYEDTLIDHLDRDIEKVTFEINARTLPVLITGYIPPHLGGLLLTWVIFRASGFPEWAIVPFVFVLAVGFIVETRMQRKLVLNKLQPRKNELENLREKLQEDIQHSG